MCWCGSEESCSEDFISYGITNLTRD
uniref:Uncharacterized protein n=1 Tax=Arundo donax TaxID=35708 RepID=A0A0A9F5P9_ARUDO